MQPSFENPPCPVCQHNDVVDHIEVATLENRIKRVDRRCSVDFAFLSLIDIDRRKCNLDRRDADISNLIVEHSPVSNKLCLKCTHEWHA